MKGSDDMQTTTTARPDLLTASMDWAFDQSGSQAKTSAGRVKAVWDWLERYQRTPIFGADNTINDPLVEVEESREQQLARLYLDALVAPARRAMNEEFARRARWARTKKQAAQVPLYVRHFLYATDAPQTTKVTWQRAAGSLLPDGYCSRTIASIAFDRAHWGRLRKCYIGENRHSAGIHTKTNGKWGWSKVSWHYADYTAIKSKDGRRVWVKYPDGSTGEYLSTPAGTTRIEGNVLFRPTKKEVAAIRVHHLRRYYSSPIRRLAGITWVWDHNEKAGYYLSSEGEKYHTEARPKGSARKYYLEAVRAFQQRRAEQAHEAKREAAKRRLAEHADRIFVAIEDSLAAGNCRTMTESFAQQLLAELTGGYPAAVRADVLLARRNDSYTQRACIQAAMAH